MDCDIKVRRVYDVALCLNYITQDKFKDLISEDSAKDADIIPDVVNDIWVAVTVNGQLAAISCLKYRMRKSIECHLYVGMSGIKDKKQIGLSIIEWIRDNLDVSCLIVECASIYKNVSKYAQSIGFSKVGVLNKSYLKNNELHDLEIYQRIL